MQSSYQVVFQFAEAHGQGAANAKSAVLPSIAPSLAVESAAEMDTERRVVLEGFGAVVEHALSARVGADQQHLAEDISQLFQLASQQITIEAITKRDPWTSADHIASQLAKALETERDRLFQRHQRARNQLERSLDELERTGKSSPDVCFRVRQFQRGFLNRRRKPKSRDV